MFNPAINTVTVRLARPSDARQLALLAALDSAAAPEGDLVVAESDGRIVAAMPLAGGMAIADPFVRTAALVELIGLRARQLRAAVPARRTSILDRLRVLQERPVVRVN